MTARFLLHLREWDHRVSHGETDQWTTCGREGDRFIPIQFKKADPQWTINDVLSDDPLLKPVPSEVNSDDQSFSGDSLSGTGR